MNIIDFLRECKEPVKGLLSFGHGPRSYANLEEENEAMQRYGWGVEFPRMWVYPVNATDDRLSNGKIQRVHHLDIDINTLCELSSSSEDLERHLVEMGKLADEIELRIFMHESFRGLVGKVERRPMYHYLDANLTGWVLSLSIKIDDTLEYPCQ